MFKNIKGCPTNKVKEQKIKNKKIKKKYLKNKNGWFKNNVLGI